MPHYYDYKQYGTNIVLCHSDGYVFCASRVDAENKLQLSIHNWAAEDTTKAREEMALLTRLVRES